MKEPIRIVKNVLSMISGSVLDKIIGFLLIILIARYLGDGGLGKYSFAFAFSGIFLLFSEFGVETYILREIAKHPAQKKKLIQYLLSVKGTLSLFLLVAVAPLLFLLTKQEKGMTLIVLLAGIALFFDSLRYAIGVLFLALEEAEISAYSLILERLASLILAYLLMPALGLVGLMAALITGYFLGFASSAFFAWKRHKITATIIRPEVSKYFKLIKLSLPFWLTTVFSFIYFRLDTLMLGYMKSYEVVGWYNAAYSLVLGLGFIPGAFIAATFPVMSRYFKEKKKTLLKNLYERVVYYMIILGLPIAVGTTILADRIILFVFKESFLPAAGIALKILIWSAMFYFVNSVMGYLLNSIDQQAKFTKSTGLAALLNIVLNFALIPKFSYVGAGIATVATFLFSFLLLKHYSSISGYKINFLRAWLKPAVASLIMLVVVLKTIKFHVGIIAFAGAAVYFTVLILIKGISSKELGLFKLLAEEVRKKSKTLK